MPAFGANGKVAPCLGLFCFAAFCCSMIATYSCEFFAFEIPEGVIIGGSTTPIYEISYGIWRVKYDGECADADFDRTPDQFKAARAMSVLTTIFGSLLAIAGCAMSCIPLPAMFFKCFGVAFFFATLFEGLKFVIAIDAQNYSLKYAAHCCIAAACLWFVCMLMSCAVKPPEDDEKEEEGENNE
eukprot:CAMPEP_0185726796 /NCGR_PEP_ID=MMETSP1171-20130828/2671_1 /TAXON_ID=374046 /ORGANISM="Helicotheca tamensis, Strain CCMP826" /LENGTH=183 /DNA_ID=CAMNT_0028395217 /DNA_START=176 /DNA_END=727 /DNA_ORIENTATION=+